jgi:hypothetical protein
MRDDIYKNMGKKTSKTSKTNKTKQKLIDLEMEVVRKMKVYNDLPERQLDNLFLTELVKKIQDILKD